MAASLTTIETEFADLVEGTFSTFCEEIGAMFEWEMESERKDVCVETVKGLQKRFKKFVAVYDVKTKGILNGTFQVIFDHAGLFTLAGMIVMLPDKLITKHRKFGTMREAEEINDSIKEAGNLFIGSLDKVFREGMEGHGHFLHTNTFVGEPWKATEKYTGEAFAEEFLFVICEMKIDPYPAFQCGITFPKDVYESTVEPSADVQPEAQVETDQKDQTAKTGNDLTQTEEAGMITPDIEPSDAVDPGTPIEVASQDQAVEVEDSRSSTEEAEMTTPDMQPSDAVDPEVPIEVARQDQTVEVEESRSSTEEAEMTKPDIQPSDAVDPEVPIEVEPQDQTVEIEESRSSTEEAGMITPDIEQSDAVDPGALIEVEPQEQTVETENNRSSTEEKENIPQNAEPAVAVETKAQDEVVQQAEKTKDNNPSSEEQAKVESENKKTAADINSPSDEKASVRKEEQPAKTDQSNIRHEPTTNAIADMSDLCAKDVMQEKVLWCDSEEGMGEVFAKMCQSGMNYAVIGPEEAPVGIVSMSDLRAGMSPYLRPEFAKWRRPIDDASLRIKIKWLMNKEVHTVKSQDVLPDVASSLCRLGLLSMPVVDQEGKIEGMVNVFDVLRTLSRSDTKVAMKV